jgi:hypothetical protein
MKRLLLIAILVISTVPLYAHGQLPNATKLKADAQKVVKIISGDRFKTQTYCEIGDLSDQIDEEENLMKTEQLSREIRKLEEKLGLNILPWLAFLRTSTQILQTVGKSVQCFERSRRCARISNGTTTEKGATECRRRMLT